MSRIGPPPDDDAPQFAGDIDPQQVVFLWNDRVPRGMITVVAGRPDQGKGLFAVYLAAQVAAAGGKVLYSATEDSHSLMTVPRLRSALEGIFGNEDPQADKQIEEALDRILLWRLMLPQQHADLEALVEEEELDLVIIDPLASHLGKGISRHSDTIRVVLNPVAKLCEKTGLTVLVIEHALKRVPKSGHPLDAIGGSGSGLPAASRAAFVFGRDPDSPDRRILCPAKFNVGPLPKAWAFEIDTIVVEGVGEIPFLTDDDEVDPFDPMSLFASKLQPRPVGRPSDKRSAAAEWVTTYLAKNGPTKATTITEDARQNGMSVKTLRRAAEDMEVVKTPPGGGRNCVWDLPKDVKEMMGIDDEEEASDDVADEGVDSGISLEDGLDALLGGDGDVDA